MNLDAGEDSGTFPLLPEAHSDDIISDEHEVRGGDTVNLATGRVDIEVVHWTKEEMQRLITKYEEELIDMVNRNGIPLLCDAIAERKHECATMLLKHAQWHNKFVDLGTGYCRTLDWALTNRSEMVAKFVLDSVAEEKLPWKESCRILTEYFFPLLKKLPHLVMDDIKKDKFSFEYGRFSVSRSLIEKNKNRPIAMITDEPPERFRWNNAEKAREFWIKECKEHSNDLKEDSTEFQVEVAAKFFCIKDPAVSPAYDNTKERLCVRLYRQDFPVEVFESEVLRNLVDWWFHYNHHIYQSSIILDGAGTMAFTIFSQSYGYGCEVEATRWPLSIGLLLFSFVTHSLGTLYYLSLRRFCIMLIESVLLVLTCMGDHYSRHSAFLTSLACVLQWISIFRLSQPFDRMGPFISMVNSAIADSWRFLLLIAVMVFSYSIALMALFETGSIKGDDGNFSSLPRAIETLFYSCIGNFEVEMFRSSSNLLAVWATLLFASFIYIGPIVLISLLIAILTDTYDKVRSKEKAELTKLRLRIMARCRLENRRVFAQLPQSIRQFLVRLSTLVLKLLRRRFVTAPDGFFHYLVPVEGSQLKSHDQEWQGRLVAIERAIKSEAQKNMERLEEQRAVLGKEMAEKNKKMNRMEAAMDQTLQKLDRIGPSSS